MGRKKIQRRKVPDIHAPDHESAWSWVCDECCGVVMMTPEEVERFLAWIEGGYSLGSVVRLCVECFYKHHPPTKKEGVQMS